MINHRSLHRTAKYFMDIGRANSPREALDILKRFGLSIKISENAARTYNGQLALLTLVNLARRTLLPVSRCSICPTCLSRSDSLRPKPFRPPLRSSGGESSLDLVPAGQPHSSGTLARLIISPHHRGS